MSAANVSEPLENNLGDRSQSGRTEIDATYRADFAGNLAHDEPEEYLWTMNFGPQHPATHTHVTSGVEARR